MAYARSRACVPRSCKDMPASGLSAFAWIRSQTFDAAPLAAAGLVADGVAAALPVLHFLRRRPAASGRLGAVRPGSLSRSFGQCWVRQPDVSIDGGHRDFSSADRTE